MKYLPKYQPGRPIKCIKCDRHGGTLVKVADNQYVHQNKELCKVLQG